MISTAVISPCGAFRYLLTRVWDASLPILLFVMLNPSTADASTNDPTVQRIMRIAVLQGYGGIEIVNLWAYRTKSPGVLAEAGWPVGPDNDEHIIAACVRARHVVCAWGANARKQPARRDHVVDLITMFTAFRPMALRKSADGTPWHPLYLPDATPLIPL